MALSVFITVPSFLNLWQKYFDIMHYDFQSFYEKKNKPQTNPQFCHHSFLRRDGMPENAPGSESYQLFILTEIRTRETGPATNIVQIFLKGLFTICSGCSIVKLHVLQDIFESSSRSVSSKYQNVAIRSQKSEQNLYSAKNISTQLSFPFLSTPMEQFLLIAMKSC